MNASSVHPELEGRLTWVLEALESVLLRDAEVPTRDTIAERLALVVSPSHEERLRIRQRVVATYAVRDRSIPHPPALRDVELLAAILSDVFRFFAVLIGRHQRYPTPDAFRAAIDQHPRG